MDSAGINPPLKAELPHQNNSCHSNNSTEISIHTKKQGLNPIPPFFSFGYSIKAGTPFPPSLHPSFLFPFGTLWGDSTTSSWFCSVPGHPRLMSGVCGVILHPRPVMTHFIHALEFLWCSKGLGSRIIHPQPVCSARERGRLIPDTPGGTPDSCYSIHPSHPSPSSFQAGSAPRLLLLQSVPSCVKWQPTNFLELVGR